ncbi:MAG: hypothetical protein KA801_15820 [Syntrophorhabdaceae bacterium]|nr:hypothetical protein [Syntrophorhabdaceae bacterium]
MRSDLIARRFLRASLVVAVIVCGLFLMASQVLAGPLDSIPVGPSDRMLLNQSVTLSDNGAASNLFVPQQGTVFFDIAVQSGKEVLLMVITEDQWQAISSGEKPSGQPILRVTVGGVDTRSVSLPRGTYTVAMFPRQGATQVTMRARARY